MQAATIKIPVLKEYAPLFKAKTRYKVCYGSRGSGKSSQIARYFVSKCRSHSYFRGVLMREVGSDIRHSQFQEIKDLIEDLGIAHEFDIKEGTMEFKHHHTGNNILSKGFKKSAGNQTARVKSIKDPTHVWVEEADEVTWEDFRKADASVRTTKADWVEMILSLNTDNGETWVRKNLIEADRDDVTAIQTTYKDNLKNLQESYVKMLENLKTIDPDAYEVDALGEWGVKKVQKPFAVQYNKNKHTGKVKYNPRYAVHFSIDFNYDPFGLLAFQMWTDKEGEHCHIIDEFSITDGTIEKLCNEIKAKYGHALHLSTFTGDYGGTHKRIGETDNRSLFEKIKDRLKLSKNQFKLISNPRHKTSKSDCNYFLMHYPDFKINPEICVGLCRDLRVVQVDAMGNIIKRNRKDESQLADHLDCFRYIINTYFKEWIKRHESMMGLRK